MLCSEVAVVDNNKAIGKLKGASLLLVWKRTDYPFETIRLEDRVFRVPCQGCVR